jgi:hypothetical protein
MDLDDVHDTTRNAARSFVACAPPNGGHESSFSRTVSFARTARETIIRSDFLKFAYPPRWHYDVLRGLDYFQWVDAPRDERLAEAIDLVRTKRGDDGRWSLPPQYPGKSYFEFERVGGPSRWNTLRALRVLAWWERRSR